MRRQLNRKEVQEVLDVLEATYPDAQAELDHRNPFEMLVATILSAQCTDVRVNMVTKDLFPAYPTPETMGSLSQEELEAWIKPCGFFHTKAKNILATCQILAKEYGGQVPETIEELVKLPGVGKKTANVVASNCFNVDAIAVDTHVFRVSNRIGLAKGKTVEVVEEELMKRVPKHRWSHAHHVLIFHGRRTCASRKPHCERCSVTDWCLDYQRRTK